MTKQPTEAQVKEFWEWYGFKYLESREYDGIHQHFDYRRWELNDKENDLYYESATLPPIDLNNLFKYAVPKTREKRFMLNLSSGMLVSNTTVTLYKSKNETYQGFSEDPALALFWAIWEVIHG